MSRKSRKGRGEFICRMAVLMSLVALAIDAVLPALGQIGTSFGVVDGNDNQLVISLFFLGMACGQMLYGPFSDSYGRKPAIYLGISVFVVGSIVSLTAVSFAAMLTGRILQGFGICCCRVVGMAMIRDSLEGREMARAMSLIMVIFIIVPALAPSLGQLILFVSDWRSIFGLIVVAAAASLLWTFLRQPETLAPERRRRFAASVIGAGIVETLRHPLSRAYTLASGIIFGGFIGYLNSAQQILQLQYRLGDAFSLYFGVLAAAIGLSSFINARLVMRFGVERPSFLALLVLSGCSLVFALVAGEVSEAAGLWPFMAYLIIAFFCFGILFGGFSTLAVQPLGHIAGVATSVISSLQTLVSTLVGGIIGWCYNGTVLPLVWGFFFCGTVSLAIMVYVRRIEGKRKASR
jgi:MFS transporter, DHA1 family, multidrug resistance protein